MSSSLQIRFERQAFRKITATSSGSPRRRTPTELDFTLVSNTPGITLFLPVVGVVSKPRDDPVLYIKATRKQFKALNTVVVHRFNLDCYLTYAGSMLGCRIVDSDAPPPYEGDVEVELHRIGKNGFQSYLATRLKSIGRLFGLTLRKENGLEASKERQKSWRYHWSGQNLPSIHVAQGWGTDVAFAARHIAGRPGRG
ncbi:hypothetical protein BS50DRAFT_585946 [Corynespora cassiicola Philippines]|uniref:Uncharacterized protein n=1 Tax=Corynespora cassiicola Philippines TaxID=1448308 RepID=A0A2T2NYP0_CORCC|nr:hypothetical protein BS50DRAFT_585946 [Corynespora cassiicola Philippines]